MSKSYKAEVLVDGETKWVSNGVAFATKEEAESYARDLDWRWTAKKQMRVVESDEPVNYVWTERGAKPLEEILG